MYYWSPMCNESFSSSSFKIFSFPLAFNSLTMMCLCAALRVFLLGICWASWIYIDCVSSDLESFLPLSLQIFFNSPLLPSVSHYVYMYELNVSPQASEAWLFFNLFPSVLSEYINSPDLYSNSLILLPS